MRIEGKEIAETIKASIRQEIQHLGSSPKLVAIKVGDDPATTSFLKIKSKVALDVGVEMEVYEANEDNILEIIRNLNTDLSVSGIIVQLPLPKSIDSKEVLNSINPIKDPDALSANSKVLSPVVLAVGEVLKAAGVELRDKKIVILGYGDLVGKPVYKWLTSLGFSPTVIDSNTTNGDEILSNADIIISGVGKPGVITADKIKNGVVVIDAGTAEQSGKLSGDLSSDAYNKCSLYTPVPGGVGPVSVAMLFKNLTVLARGQGNG